MSQPQRQVYNGVANSVHEDFIKKLKTRKDFTDKKFLPESKDCHFIRYSFAFGGEKVSIVFDTKAEMLTVTAFNDAIRIIDGIFTVINSKFEKKKQKTEKKTTKKSAEPEKTFYETGNLGADMFAGSKSTKNRKSRTVGVAKKMNSYASDERASETSGEKYYVPYNFNDIQKSRMSVATRQSPIILQTRPPSDYYPAEQSNLDYKERVTTSLQSKPANANNAQPKSANASSPQSKPANANNAQSKPANANSAQKPVNLNNAQAKPANVNNMQSRPVNGNSSQSRPANVNNSQSKSMNGNNPQQKSVNASSPQQKPANGNNPQQKPANTNNLQQKPANVTSSQQPKLGNAGSSQQPKPANVTSSQQPKLASANGELKTEGMEYKDGYSVKKVNLDSVKNIISEIKGMSSITISEAGTVKGSAGDITTYSIENTSRHKVYLRHIVKKNMLQLQGKDSALFGEIQMLISRDDTLNTTAKKSDKQPKNLYKEVKKALPSAFDYLSEQSKIDFTIGLIDINSEEVRLSDYSVLLVPPYRGLERLLFDLQKAKNIEVKMIGQAYEKDDGRYTLKAGYRKKIDSIVYNEVMSALYTEYFERRNFYAHSNNTDEHSVRVISDKTQAKSIFDNLINLINYNCKKLQEINFPK